MLAAVIAAALAVQAAPSLPKPTSGEWVVVRVDRVIAPENMPGQCFVQAHVDQVVRGRRYQPGQPVAISLACRGGGMIPTALAPSRTPPTIEALREVKRALVHLDDGARVVDGEFYNVDVAPAR